ncbi:uncharacterized protein NECHADRAFT_76537 [Fusarium vanettenii 77-13-4]|uniref:Uncharacterized protein n=1 Tax=Fusarium vanettenii (strain ATCC MYA-4622 / CBS 123669 / FGSC 9596 / NRRL 45880 / 77-13-4) TaxID=660122 RepID=C7Z4I8_FUSV7|nr:uncharacterized protein NECHADRAFT_76537 [Fusarium vanettenii 77-13-4]EEU40931.1 predicted protein [Fusarium vanettenii 77-13-4]
MSCDPTACLARVKLGQQHPRAFTKQARLHVQHGIFAAAIPSPHEVLRPAKPGASLGSANDLGAPPELSGPLDGARLQASACLLVSRVVAVIVLFIMYDATPIQA